LAGFYTRSRAAAETAAGTYRTHGHLEDRAVEHAASSFANALVYGLGFLLLDSSSLHDVGKHQINNTWRALAGHRYWRHVKTQAARLDFWRQLIAKQQESGMSVHVFCQQHGTSEYSFYHWRKRLRGQLPMKFALASPVRWKES
jgi:hypothetical protein